MNRDHFWKRKRPITIKSTVGPKSQFLYYIHFMKMDTTSWTHSMNITGLKNLQRHNITEEQGCLEGVAMGVLHSPELAPRGVILGPVSKWHFLNIPCFLSIPKNEKWYKALSSIFWMTWFFIGELHHLLCVMKSRK